MRGVRRRVIVGLGPTCWFERNSPTGCPGADDSKGRDPMTTSSVAQTPDPTRMWPSALRALLLGMTLVILLAIGFTVGHLTAGSHQASPASGAAQVQTSAGGAADISSLCPVGPVRGPC
jgi:hypothetical protein